LRQHTKVYGQPTKRLEDLGSFSWHPKRSEIGKTAKQPAYCLGDFFEKQDHVVLGYPICTYLGVWAVVFSPAGAGESNPIYMGLMLSHPANPVSMFILWRDNKIFNLIRITYIYIAISGELCDVNILLMSLLIMWFGVWPS
jgi:hypothetical protein